MLTQTVKYIIPLCLLLNPAAGFSVHFPKPEKHVMTDQLKPGDDSSFYRDSKGKQLNGKNSNLNSWDTSAFEYFSANPGDIDTASDILINDILIKYQNNKWILDLHTMHKFDNESIKYVNVKRLKPGKYIFRVKDSKNNLVWSDQGKSLDIIIESSIWKSNITIFVFLVILFAIVLLLFIYRLKNIKRTRFENMERESNAQKILDQKEELAIKNKNITDSINYAKRIQSALMPSEKLFKTIFPDSFILHIPKDIVSGDFYWINSIGNKAFIAAIDCTGHGVPGAFMSIIGFELFRNITNIEGIQQPAKILAHLNSDFQNIFSDVENITLKDGMDIAFCLFDKKNMILEYAGALNPMYLIRDNKINEFKGDRFSVGLDSNEDIMKAHGFKNHTISLMDGDIIYIFSDGYADQFGGPEGKKFKYRRFRHLLLAINQLPMSKQHDYLKNSFFKWKAELEQVDDILIIGFKINSKV